MTTATWDFRTPAAPEPVRVVLEPISTLKSHDEWVDEKRRMVAFLAIYIAVVGFIVYRIATA